MEAWRKSWRDCVSPKLSTAGLQALKTALETDARELIQSVTAKSIEVSKDDDDDYGDYLENDNLECRGACAVGYCLWKGDGIANVRDIEATFVRMRLEVDEEEFLKFIWWYDGTARDLMRAELLPEVELSLVGRGVN